MLSGLVTSPLAPPPLSCFSRATPVLHGHATAKADRKVIDVVRRTQFSIPRCQMDQKMRELNEGSLGFPLIPIFCSCFLGVPLISTCSNQMSPGAWGGTVLDKRQGSQALASPFISVGK